MTQKRFYGKYRGSVVNNIDPMFQGRLQVAVPAVLGTGLLSWAMPCVPYAAPGRGLYLIPPIGASIWVEFEGGDPDYPIWAGCFWGRPGEAPGIREQTKILKTDGVELTFADDPGAARIELKLTPPLATLPVTVTADARGVSIGAGGAKIDVTPTSVLLNDGALEVT